jgi:hypothetical protein
MLSIFVILISPMFGDFDPRSLLLRKLWMFGARQMLHSLPRIQRSIIRTRARLQARKSDRNIEPGILVFYGTRWFPWANPIFRTRAVGALFLKEAGIDRLGWQPNLRLEIGGSAGRFSERGAKNVSRHQYCC